MAKCKLINSDTEKHTRITSWVKFKSLELSVFALEIPESLRANMVAHQADVNLWLLRLQFFIYRFFLKIRILVGSTQQKLMIL